MVIRRHEDIAGWQLAKELERRVCAFIATAAASRDVACCQQIRDPSSSAASNIAEGFGRFWPLEFANKLRIAIGELRETQNHLSTALDRKYLDAKYLESAGPDWKKTYRASRRGKLIPGVNSLPGANTKEPEEPRTHRTQKTLSPKP